MRTLWGNNSRILRMKNAKFSGYHFCMNQNIKGDFQICISVPLNVFKYKMSRSLQFWCKSNTREIVKTCPFRFLCDYYGDSLDAIFPQFPNNFLQFPMVFPHVSLVFLQFPRVFLLFRLSVLPVSYFRFCVWKNWKLICDLSV